MVGEITIAFAAFGSREQQLSVDLRDRILRKPLGLQFTPEYLAAEKDHLHLLAFRNGQVVGVLVLQPLSSQEIKMRQVAVDADQQRLGIGSLLVKASEKYARENGYAVISMHARETACPFYERLGYHIVGERFMEVGIPHFRMEKRLQ